MRGRRLASKRRKIVQVVGGVSPEGVGGIPQNRGRALAKEKQMGV